MIDWAYRAKRIEFEQRMWATPDVWRARRAATRSIDMRLTHRFIEKGHIPAGWDSSDYMEYRVGGGVRQ